MTKAENRAAAKAFHQEQEQKRRELAHAEAVKADLAQLESLRRYLILGWKSGTKPLRLIKAIDDCAEELSGDRTALHARSSSIG
jgi:hypothetical protein